MSITDFLLRQAKNVATRAISGVAVQQGKKVINSLMSESPEQTKARAKMLLGYDSAHYSITPQKEIKFQASPIFAHEWMTQAPENKGRILRDEESGEIYCDGELLSANNDARMKLINSFLGKTKIKSAATVSHFDNAWKLFTPTDVMAFNFKKFFAGADVSKGTPIIDTWLTNCFGDGLETNVEYAQKLFKLWMVGTAKRMLIPGSTLDGCLVFSGPTNSGKTRFFRYLLPENFENRCAEVYCDKITDPKKMVENILGKTIVNFDEMSALDTPKKQDQWKQLITSQSIQVRLAWRKDPQRYALRQGFGATTNKEKFITDPTLSRRMWVLKLSGKQQLNFDYLYANRKALWQEAIALAQTDFNTYLMPKDVALVEEHNKEFYV